MTLFYVLAGLGLTAAVLLMVAIAVADSQRDQLVVDQVAPRTGRHHWNDSTREQVAPDWTPHIGRNRFAAETHTQPLTWPLNDEESETTR